MIIEINDDLFYKLVELMKNRNTTIYNELKDIKPLDTVATDTLAKARELKTQKVKQLISRTIKELLSQDIQPTKYKIKWKLLIIEQTYWNSVAP